MPTCSADFMSIAQHYGKSVWHKTNGPSLTTLAASNILQDKLGIPALENQRSIKKPLIDLTWRPYKIRLGRRVLGDVLEEPEKRVTGGAISLNDRRATSAPRESASFAYFSSLVRTMVADPPKGLRASTT